MAIATDGANMVKDTAEARHSVATGFDKKAFLNNIIILLEWLLVIK